MSFLMKAVALALMVLAPAAPNTRSGPRSHRAVATAGLSFTSVAAGVYHTCALTSAGQAYCWGSNTLGALGNGTLSGIVMAPQPVVGGLSFIALGAGLYLTCGITTTFDAYCWGSNSVGQLGNGSTLSSGIPTPSLVIGGKKFGSITVQKHTVCAVTRTTTGGLGGQLYCWGSNAQGQAGTGSTQSPLKVPTLVSSPAPFSRSDGSDRFTCGLTTTGQVLCWGENDAGELGNNTLTSHFAPQATSGSQTYRQIVAGDYHACGLLAVPPPPPGQTLSGPVASAVYCWGSNHLGELGVGSAIANELVPTRLPNVAYFTLAARGRVSCGISLLYDLYCWGDNSSGQLGVGTPSGNQPVPTQVLSGLKFSAVSAGGFHACGLTTSKLLYCWGSNGAGQLGLGTTISALVPTRVVGQ